MEPPSLQLAKQKPCLPPLHIGLVLVIYLPYLSPLPPILIATAVGHLHFMPGSLQQSLNCFPLEIVIFLLNKGKNKILNMYKEYQNKCPCNVPLSLRLY